MPKHHAIVVIPARLKSSRLPEKVILDLAGKSVVERVFDQAKKAIKPDAVYIATDSKKIVEVCNSFTTEIIMTSDSHISGTDRIAEAVAGIDSEIVVNVQGDEPFIDPSLIDQLIAVFEDQDLQMASVMIKIKTKEEYLNPNAVKVTVDKNNYALYFSRACIPYARDTMDTLGEPLPESIPCYKHLGIYAYRKSFLSTYTQLPSSPLELTEKLEQLRVLDHGYKIKMIETKKSTLGIDTIEDLEKAKKLFQLNSKK